MKRENKQQYLDEGGIKCPYCRSEDIWSQSRLITEPVMYQKVDCHTCNRTWVDEYTLTDVLTEH